jgi:hypothetical protein
MPNRIEAFNTAIENLKASQPKFDELTTLWKRIFFSRTLLIIKQKYITVNLTDEQLNKIANVDVELYRSSLSDEVFQNELIELHKQAIEVSIKQLESERDNPPHHHHDLDEDTYDPNHPNIHIQPH